MSGHVLAAIESGCMVGEADGGFHPDDPVTRAELAVAVACLAGVAPHPLVPAPDPCLSGDMPACIRQEWSGSGAEDWAVQLAWCESRHNPSARNVYSSASGLFQFLNSTWLAWGDGDVFDPKANAAAARRLWEALGPSQWSCHV